MKYAVTPVFPAFFVVPARDRAEEYAARLQAGTQFQQHARQFLARDVKKRRIGEDAVEIGFGQIELEKILQPYFAAAVEARHRGKTRGSFQTDSDVAKFGKAFKVAPGPAAEIEQCERMVARDVL